MGRKKKQKEEEPREPEPREREEEEERKPTRDSDDSSSEEEPVHYPIDAEIQELAYGFNIDAGLTQRLNDIMIRKRTKTWEQDLERLHELLKEAHSPAAVLNLKVRDMEKGVFVGKSKCEPRVRELCVKHRLDKGATTKLLEAMAMREGMGKDIDKDLFLLDEHLSASNAPSKLVSMKLDSLRKGYSLGHCIYSREPVQGNQGPGVDGVFDQKRKRVVGYSDADLDIRFAQQDRLNGTGGQLMDEETVRKMMAAERKQHEAKKAVEATRKAKRSRSRRRPSPSRERERDKRKASRSRSKKKRKSRSRSKDKTKRKSRSPSRAKKRASPSVERRKRASPSVERKKSKRSRSKSKEKGKDKKRSSSRSKDKKRAQSKSAKRKASRSRSAKKKKSRSSSNAKRKSSVPDKKDKGRSRSRNGKK